MKGLSHLPPIVGRKGIDLTALPTDDANVLHAVLESVEGHKKFSARIHRLAYAGLTDAEAFVYLSRLCGYGIEANRRRSWFGGRVWNYAIGQSGQYVTIPGRILIKLFRDAELAIPSWMRPEWQYDLRLDYAEAFRQTYQAAFNEMHELEVA
ncbi:hypothetical protein [Actibacterium lipolyticum]|uniref:Uncharacterized protein n=1 Tax=Actibacterium lipolyticum TaxID=1524263 RepID=A0A238JXE0_9RHOB|nr:hypothetical protein [Actibacterium lipolyticum]SMX34814.1 hypothetical protein COL8621_01502 [Actibacterium lipolyticum]